MAVLKLYYTGADSHLAEQALIDKSLGGYFSSSPIPNDVFSNLFGEISKLTIDRDSAEYIAVALKNETGGDVTDIEIGYEYGENNQAILEVAAVIPALDKCDDPFIETIPNKYAKPLVGDFNEANVAKATAELVVTQGAGIGDVVDIIVGGVTIASTAAFAVVTGVEGVVDAIILAMTGNADYTAAKKVSGTTYSVVMTGVNYGVDVDLVEFQISGTDIATPQNLAGGADNAVAIGDLVADGYIGLWLRRSLTDRAKQISKGQGDGSCDALAEAFENGQSALEQTEEIQFNIEWT